jgi:hypothetical protein
MYKRILFAAVLFGFGTTPISADSSEIIKPLTTDQFEQTNKLMSVSLRGIKKVYWSSLSLSDKTNKEIGADFTKLGIPVEHFLPTRHGDSEAATRGNTKPQSLAG